MPTLSTAAQAYLLRTYRHADAHAADVEAALKRLDDALGRKHEETRAFYAARVKPEDMPKFYEPRASGPPSETDEERSTRQAGFLDAAWRVLSRREVPDVTWPMEQRRQWAYEVLALADLATNPDREWDGVPAWDEAADYNDRIPRRLFLDGLKHDGGVERFEELVARALGIVETAAHRVEDGSDSGKLESAVAGDGDEEIRHAPDFSWIVAGSGVRYDFPTGRQRDIMQALYSAWKRGGDGASMTEAAILEELGDKVDRLRVARAFDGHPALGAILRRSKGRGAIWSLHLAARAGAH